ncbi:hypothetical protein ACVDFE_35890 [Lentzea chajnantorensis]
MLNIRRLGTKSSATHCMAPTGKKGRHCGKPIGKGRMSNGVTCFGTDCQYWYLAGEELAMERQKTK